MTFLEVGASSGLGSYLMPREGHGAGIAAADFDDDGDIDIFVPTAAGTPNQLYRNLGSGQFEEIAVAIGLGDTQRGRAALWLDYDADHRLDLLVAGDCNNEARSCLSSTQILRLYRQLADGSFVEIADAAGLHHASENTNEHFGGLAAGDVNGDGYLDVLSGFWKGTVKLFLNQGDGTFLDGSQASGLDAAKLGYHQPVMVDFDQDGLLDLYAPIDVLNNRLWMSQGVDSNGIPIYVDVAEAGGCDNAMNDMGITVGDFDDDGDPDIYISNIFREDQHNILLRNDSSTGDSSIGTAVCTEISGLAGVQDGGWGWGTTFFDADNDGFLDLAETSGWHNGRWEEPIRLFLHQRDTPPTFVDRAAEAGLTNRFWGSSLIAFDADRDGDLDLMRTVAPVDSPDGSPISVLELYHNQLEPGLSGHHYLVIRPRMAGPNHRAIGARVEVRIGERTMTRWILAGTSYLGQEPAEAFFGLGTATVADEVTVHWPNGGQTTVRDVSANQVQTASALFIEGFECGNLEGWTETLP